MLSLSELMCRQRFIDAKTDLTFRLLFRAGWRNNELPYRLEHNLELLIVLLLHFLDLLREFLVTSEHFPQCYKCPHNLYVHTHCSFALENA